jgi:hypothetical protein
MTDQDVAPVVGLQLIRKILLDTHLCWIPILGLKIHWKISSCCLSHPVQARAPGEVQQYGGGLGFEVRTDLEDSASKSW